MKHPLLVWWQRKRELVGEEEKKGRIRKGRGNPFPGNSSCVGKRQYGFNGGKRETSMERLMPLILTTLKGIRAVGLRPNRRRSHNLLLKKRGDYMVEGGKGGRMERKKYRR
jgi:hypothetical protein